MPRNQRLFRALERIFGRGQVHIARPGKKLLVAYQQQLDEDGRIMERMRRVSSGEEYQVKCPICRDHKRRLSISYRWGEEDERTGRINLWLIQCWNEQCFSDFEIRKDFFDRVYSSGPTRVDDLAEYSEASELVKKGKPRMPGKIWRIDKLAAKSPRHEAVLYAQQRLMDIDELGEIFGVGFCPNPDVFAARNRLIAPVLFAEKLAGWTGRYIGSDRPAKIPKWFHDPNMEKSALLYNWDVARTLHTKIIVEGPGDAWGCGVRGTAILGKKLSDIQINILSEASTGGGTLVLMLDPSQDEVSRRKKYEHHMTVALRALQQAVHCPVLPVYLPEDTDPGSMDRGYIFGLIKTVARAASVEVQLDA